MDDRVKNLYAGPLEEFVAERNALARTLRETGEPHAAAEVRSLRKPTVPAWALNQLSHRQPGQVERLLEAADRLGQVQLQAMTGGRSAGELREAITAYRDAMENLTRMTAEVLEQAGISPASHMAEVTASLQAATVDEEARRHLREGTVTRPFAAPGLAGLAPGVAALPGSGPPLLDSDSELQESRQDELAAARRAADEARERHRKARQLLRALEQTAEQLDRSAERAGKRAERLAAEAEDAEREAREARQRADEASEAVRRARTELDEAERAMKAIVTGRNDAQSE